MDELNGTDEQTEGQQESAVIRELRAKANAADEAIAKLAQIERERAIEKSGVDLDSGPGKLFLKAWDGDHSDGEAIKAAAKEFGVPLRGEQTTEPQSESGQTGSPSEAGTTQQEPTGTAERQALAQGAPADEGTQVDPRQQAIKAAEAIRGEGGTWDDEMAVALGTIAEAANRGDPRVTLDPRTGQRRVGV